MSLPLRSFRHRQVNVRRRSIGDGDLRLSNSPGRYPARRLPGNIRTRGAKLPSVVPCPAPNRTPAISPRLVENRAAGVALAGFDVELDHLVREVRLRRVIVGAAAGGDAVFAAAVAVDREQVALPRRLRRRFSRVRRSAARSRAPPGPNRESTLSGRAWERKPSGKTTSTRPVRVADDVPVGDHEAVLFATPTSVPLPKAVAPSSGTMIRATAGMRRYVVRAANRRSACVPRAEQKRPGARGRAVVGASATTAVISEREVQAASSDRREAERHAAAS